jgi:UDP:flavonoid glycosyltransferase YjiC (YdhE family)
VRIVVASLPAYGHLYPMLPFAQACAAAGHEVTVATGTPFLDALPLPTTAGIPADVTLQDIEREALSGLTGDGPMDFVIRMFGTVTAGHVEPVLSRLLADTRPDLVIYEMTNVGAALAAERAGIRSIAFGLGLWNPVIPIWHSTAGADDTLPGGYLDPMPASVQNPLPLPARRIPIRTVAWAPPLPLPAWFASSVRPRVYVTLGTVSFGAVDVLRRAVLETAAHDVDVLVAVGPAGDPALLGEMPSNVHLERFVSQAEVLRNVDAIVHHGGAGTMLGALANGLPQLILPQGADHPFNAAAIERTGAGRAIANEDQVPGAIEHAVGALLTEGRERLTAKRVAEEIAAMPSPKEVAAWL